MSEARDLNTAFRLLKKQFTAKTKRNFLNDIRGQLEENDEISEILQKRGAIQYLAVTFDRKKNDKTFSYNYLDVALVTLDAIWGGHGIYKPSNQMRALRWDATPADLLFVLRIMRGNNHQMRFRRALILPFPIPVVGYKIDKQTHMR